MRDQYARACSLLRTPSGAAPLTRASLTLGGEGREWSETAGGNGRKSSIRLHNTNTGLGGGEGGAMFDCHITRMSVN